MPENKGWSTLLGALPFVGGIASTILQRRWALKDQERQNQYNSPQHQLALLKQAGLPAAAYFSGGVSAQSESPRDTPVNTGASEYFNKMAVTEFQKKQMAVMEAEAREKNANADVKVAERDYLLGAPGQLGGKLGAMAQEKSPLETRLGAEIQHTVIGNQQQQVSLDVARKYAEPMAAQEFRNKINQDAALRQQMQRVQQEIQQAAKINPQLIAEKKAQIRNIEAQIQAIKAGTAKTREDTRHAKEINPTLETTAKQQLEKLEQENALLKIQVRLAETNASWQVGLMEAYENTGDKISFMELVIQRLLYGGFSVSQLK